MSRVGQLDAGEEWVIPLRRGKAAFRIICCDCGLAHDGLLEVKDGKLIMRWYENRKSTSATRRKHA